MSRLGQCCSHKTSFPPTRSQTGQSSLAAISVQLLPRDQTSLLQPLLYRGNSATRSYTQTQQPVAFFLLLLLLYILTLSCSVNLSLNPPRERSAEVQAESGMDHTLLSISSDYQQQINTNAYLSLKQKASLLCLYGLTEQNKHTLTPRPIFTSLELERKK